jgi:nanoRNase/pAp phosphatase (c-di-AMP/oligoRNAs hydrolase)
MSDLEKPVRGAFADRVLVVGPKEPVDGDSIASTKALINFLRSQGKQAYTLPTVAIYDQIDWLIEIADISPAALAAAPSVVDRYHDSTTADLQKAYDAALAEFNPGEIILVDGQPEWLGFDTRGVKVYTIDHHVKNGTRNDQDAFIQKAPSAGGLLIDYFGIYDPILAVSLLTDTFWLRQNSPVKAVRLLAKLTENGLTDELLVEMQRKLMVKKDPQIIEEMRHSNLSFSPDGESVVAFLKSNDPEIHRGIVGELGYFARHLCVVRADGYASLRTVDRNLDMAKLAGQFKGGGHHNVAAAHLDNSTEDLLKADFEGLRKAFFDLCKKPD